MSPRRRVYIADGKPLRSSGVRFAKYTNLFRGLPVTATITARSAQSTSRGRAAVRDGHQTAPQDPVRRRRDPGWRGLDGFNRLVVAADPATLPAKATWYLATNLPRPGGFPPHTARAAVPVAGAVSIC